MGAILLAILLLKLPIFTSGQPLANYLKAVREPEQDTTIVTPTIKYEDSDINAQHRKSEIFDQLLGPSSNYDTKVRAPGASGSGPVIVGVNLHIRSIENIDDVRMEYTAQMVYRQSWIDPRVKFGHLQSNVVYLQLVQPNRVWTPDVFFANEKKGVLHELITPNVFTRIFANGSILQSFRLTLLLACPMSLHGYPMDVQVCCIRMASYGWTTKDLILHWLDDPVQINSEFNMPQFKLLSYSTSECESLSISGNYSCVMLKLSFKRSFGYYLIQIYIPCALLVIVSWVSFWLEPTACEARVSIGVTTILTIVTQTYGINQSVPPASYLKALDVWSAVCQVLVFSGLMQFALVNYVIRIKRYFIVPSTIVVELKETKEEEERVARAEAALAEKCYLRAKRIDRISRAGFPLVFFLFNVTYWSAYFPFSETFA